MRTKNIKPIGMEGLVHVLIHDGNPEGARQSVEGRTCGTVGLKPGVNSDGSSEWRIDRKR